MGERTREQIHRELAAIEATRAALLRELADEPALPATKEEARWMRLRDYAAARSMSIRTLHSRITEGLPTVGEGHGRRVVVAAADEWLKSRRGVAA